MSISDNDSLCDFNIYNNDIFFDDDNIDFSNGLADVVFNNHELRNFNNDDLNFIFSSEPKQGEINDREITYSLWKFKNEIDDRPKKKRAQLHSNSACRWAPEKPRKQQQQQPKQDIPIIYYI